MKYKVISQADLMNKKSEVSKKKITTEIDAPSIEEIQSSWSLVSYQIKSDLAGQGKFVLGEIEFVKAIPVIFKKAQNSKLG